MAYEALEMEPHIGVMLPCNVVVQATEDGVEVAAIDPAASMQAVGNPRLLDHAASVGLQLRKAIDAL